MDVDGDLMQVIRIPLHTGDELLDEYVLEIMGNNGAVAHVSFDENWGDPEFPWFGVDDDTCDIWDLDVDTGYPACGIVIRDEGEDLSDFARQVLAAVHSWESGDFALLSELEPIVRGSPLQMACYRVLLALAPGELITYSELAVRAGYPGASRAAAHACAINPLPLLVPCHRVIPAAGMRAMKAGKTPDFGNYFYGWQLKRALIEHELALTCKEYHAQ